MAVLGLCKVFRCAESVALHGLSGDGFPGKSCGAVTGAGGPYGGSSGCYRDWYQSISLIRDLYPKFVKAQDTHSLNRVAERPSETRVG